MLIFSTVIPRRWIQRQRPFWPCHLAFQLGRRRTAGPGPAFLRAGKSWAWTVLFSGPGDSIELVKERTYSFSCAVAERPTSRRQSVAEEAAYQSRLFSMACWAYWRTNAPGLG